jgi:phosphatidate cytidylyltransferase
MLRDRVAIALLLLPLVIWVIADGRWLFVAAVTLVLALAAAEYAILFRTLGFRPALPVIVLGVAALTLSRAAAWLSTGSVLTALCLGSMAWHLVDFERGAARSGTDFAITVAGFVYLGWIGSYLVVLRQMPEGLWWLLLALPTVWLADSAAYFVGKAVGRHRLSPRLSPKKTWEGYLAGVVMGAISGAGLAMVWRLGAGSASAVTAANGILMGSGVALLAPLGDLGVSMLKREAGVKDSGNLLPGHGGALDRLDSWIWAGVLGFYLANWLGR